MPSTYSSSLRLELQATGENANTWGTKTNNNLELIEQAIAGYVKITLTSASATYPLVIADASASDGRNAYIEFVGTVASAISITVPDVEKGYWVKNSATGSPLTFRTSSGTGVVLPTNQWVNLVSDGASITSTFPTSITGYALLSATQTFTGANTFTSLVNIQSNLSVTGNAFVSGVTTLASAVDIKGATSLASTLLVNGNAVFNSNVSVSGTFTVSGVANLLSAVNLRGNTSVGGTLITTGNATFSGNVSVSGTFQTSGVATFSSAVDIKGAASAASTLVVNGNATFNSNVSVSGVMVAGAGAVGAPSYSTTGDTNTGLYFPAADTIAATTNGSERLRINSTGQVLIGYTDAINVGGVSNQGLQVTGGASQRITTVRYGNDTNPASIFMGHSRAAAAGSNTIVQSGDQLGAFRFLGDDGTQFAWAATILGEVDGTPGVNDMPGRLVFSTTPDGAANPTERMRITSGGLVGIGTSSPVFTLDLNGALRMPNATVLWMNDSTGTAKETLQLYSDNNTYLSTPTALIFRTNGATERMRIDSSGNVRVGTAALATTATDGFLYVPTCAGTPTGTPTAITGLAPIVINTTNNKLYFYSGGAWRDAGP